MPTAITAEARDAAFDAFLKSQKPDQVRRLSDNSGLKIPCISTGIISLDYALGIGGLPRGRIVELFGTEGGGKSSLALAVAAEATRAGGNVGFIDAEHTMSPEFAIRLGVDLDRVAIHQPDTGEQALEMMRAMAQSAAFDVLILDSVAALVPMKEVEGEIGDQNVALLARLMSQSMRILTPVISESNAVAIFINQIREKPGQSYGNPEVTPGGRALKFSASVRLEVRSPASARIAGANKDEPVGQNVRVKVVKNKVGPPYRSTAFDLYYDRGVDQTSSVYEVALALGIIDKQGNTHFDVLDGSKMGVGQKQAVAYLEANPERVNAMIGAIHERLNGGDAVGMPLALDPDVVPDDDPDADDLDVSSVEAEVSSVLDEALAGAAT